MQCTGGTYHSLPATQAKGHGTHCPLSKVYNVKADIYFAFYGKCAVY